MKKNNKLIEFIHIYLVFENLVYLVFRSVYYLEHKRGKHILDYRR